MGYRQTFTACGGQGRGEVARRVLLVVARISGVQTWVGAQAHNADVWMDIVTLVVVATSSSVAKVAGRSSCCQGKPITQARVGQGTIACPGAAAAWDIHLRTLI